MPGSNGINGHVGHTSNGSLTTYQFASVGISPATSSNMTLESTIQSTRGNMAQCDRILVDYGTEKQTIPNNLGGMNV